ncbi:MAG TPA: hypothetical protein VIL29_12410, partial [Pseudothermotoga sp.]
YLPCRCKELEHLLLFLLRELQFLERFLFVFFSICFFCPVEVSSIQTLQHSVREGEEEEEEM